MGDVKERPTLRDERAGVTRRRIAEAARTLFRTRGYGATTLRAVAEEAGVAVQTVYAVYGSKAGILHELRDTVLRQPAAEALYEDAMREPKVERKLSCSQVRSGDAGSSGTMLSRSIATRARPIRPCGLRSSGCSACGATASLVWLVRLRRSLTPGIDVAYATAVLDALTLPEVYAELTDSQEWSAEQFEAWLARCLKNH